MYSLKLTQTQVLWGIILTAVAFATGGIIAFNNAEADLTDQEVYRIIKDWHDDNGHLFVSQDELKMQHEIMTDAIAAPHIEIEDNESKILLNRETINELRINVAQLKNQVTGTGTPSQGTISATADNTCYEVGDLVQIDGMATPSRQLTSEIYLQGQNPNDSRTDVNTPTTQTASNGSFSLFWIIPSDHQTGTYTVKLIDAGGKFGEITVSVRSNC